MSNFITFHPRRFYGSPVDDSLQITVNTADVVKIESYEDGSASLYIRGENIPRNLYPDDVERLRSDLTNPRASWPTGEIGLGASTPLGAVCTSPTEP